MAHTELSACLQVFVQRLVGVMRTSYVCHKFHSNFQKNLWGIYCLKLSGKHVLAALVCFRTSRHQHTWDPCNTQLVPAGERDRNKHFV